VDGTNQSATMSLKLSDIGGSSIVDDQIAVLNVGDIVFGKVTKVTSFGVFVNLNDTYITALCRKIHALSTPSQDILNVFKVGDVVKGKVISVSTSSKKVGLALAENILNDILPNDEHIKNSVNYAEVYKEELSSSYDNQISSSKGFDEQKTTYSYLERENITFETGKSKDDTITYQVKL
jgi:predicted RNA-binding protein with RPS1 domain